MSRALTTADITREALKILEDSMRPHYYKIMMVDGEYAIATSLKLCDVVKMGLTEAEADAYLKLLKEQ
jgi:hypothetical protein